MNKHITVYDLDQPGPSADFGADEIAAARYAAGTPRRTLTRMYWDDGTIWLGVSDPRNGTLSIRCPNQRLRFF